MTNADIFIKKPSGKILRKVFCQPNKSFNPLKTSQLYVSHYLVFPFVDLFLYTPLLVRFVTHFKY